MKISTPSDLLRTNDAALWAEEFIRVKHEQNWTLDDIDFALMVGWIANAMAAQEFKMIDDQTVRDKEAYDLFMSNPKKLGVVVK